jgi:hydrogenase expression/formation protein HypE
VVSPLFFPGGDIGHIAVCGTVNDLAVKGAEPKWLSCAFIIEEGFDADVLERIARSMGKAAAAAGVQIVTGDTKVVEKGKGDGLFINTSGVGVIADGVNLSVSGIKPGDCVIVSGSLAEHGLAVMNERHSLGLKSGIKSDGAPLNGMIAEVLAACPHGVHAMRDLTRGGLASALADMCASCGFSFEIEEKLIPVSVAVRSACGILGIDPLSAANEGKICLFCAPDCAEKVLSVLKKNAYGKDAAAVGFVGDKAGGPVYLKTAIGSKRVLRAPDGEVLPRIC